jgi:hypothetical protein
MRFDNAALAAAVPRALAAARAVELAVDHSHVRT